MTPFDSTVTTIGQEQLWLLLEGMNAGFTLLDPEYRIVTLNQETLRVDGRDAAEMIGKTCWEVWPQLADNHIGRLIRQVMADRSSQTAGYHFVSQNGVETWLEMRVHPFGQGAAIFFRDSSERQRAEEALRGSQERFELASRATNDILWDWDVPANRIGWNAVATAFVPERDGALATTFEEYAELIHPDDRARVSGSLCGAVTGDAAYWSENYRFRKRDGDYAIIYDRGFISRDADGQAVRAVGAMVDLSEIRRTEQKVQQLQAELIHVSRLSAMGTMASTLAHELNQPLTAVSNYVTGCLRLIETDAADPVRMKSGLEGAREGAMRAGAVIRRLRAMTEKGEVRKVSANLRETIDEALALALVGASDPALTIDIDVPPDLVIQADPVQFQQVVLNLVRNAVEAMGGLHRKSLSIRAEARASEIVIAVSDTGPGVADSVRASLFEPFISGREDGMGIGLSISRTIIEAHRGRIWAEPREAGGTTFCIALPVVESPMRI